ncbi:MAG: DUF4214 domain-containing protein [Lachnospiraceae bacterium]|nr:DUF4214 domain-containing protein [Lachnospiraceae bacterium]
MSTVKKRNLIGFFTAFLLIALVSVLLPMTVKAAPAAHTAHKGHKTHDGWQAVSSEEDLINLGLKGGSGYLTSNILLSETIRVSGSNAVNLCLNGYNITGKNDYMTIIQVENKAVFNLYDETENTGKITRLNDLVGCGIYVETGTVSINGGTICGHSAKEGGGLDLYQGTVTMNGGIISDNYANKNGGGVLVSSQGKFILNGGHITNNTVTTYLNGESGGGVFSYGTFIMNGGYITGNTSPITGGGIYSCNNLRISGGYITENTAQFGAGVYAEGTTLMEKGRISDNAAVENGGGIYFLNEFTMNGGTVSENTSKVGGGVYSVGHFYMNNGSITENSANLFGGGLYSHEGSLTFNGGKITKNTAKSNGGGIYIYDAVTDFNGGTVSGNEAYYNGGGIYQNFGRLSIVDGTITKNTAGEDGAGVFAGGTVYIEGKTNIYGNKATGDGDGVLIFSKGRIVDGTVSDSIAYAEIYKVTFNPNKGSSKKVTLYGNYQNSPGIAYTDQGFKRSGYTLLKWNTKANGTGKSYGVNDEMLFDKNLNLYAQWIPNKYTVIFDANGGSGTMTEQSRKKNDKVALPANTFIKVGYTFNGWNTKADGSGTAYKDKEKANLTPVNTKKVTLYAQWKKAANVAYKVEHYRQKVDGSYPASANEIESLKGKVNASITPAVKTYKGFTAPAVQTATIKADGSLVVKYYYTRNSYKLTWDFAGGSAKGSYTKGNVKYGAKITTPVPVRDGYEFTGWDKTVPAKMPANDATFKAKWRKLSQEEQVRNFVSRFYTIILDRPAEAAGLADWTNRLISKTATGSDVAAGFINSDEFQKKKMTDEEYVTKLYLAFFDREPDKAGYDNWIKELKNGKSRDYVLRGFINSTEFNNLCKKYGINAGSY